MRKKRKKDYKWKISMIKAYNNQIKSIHLAIRIGNELDKIEREGLFNYVYNIQHKQ